MKQAASKIKMELAQYSELQVFAQFDSDLDKATRDQLNRGKRIMEILKTKTIYALRSRKTNNFILCINKWRRLDDIDAEDVRNFEEELLLSMENTSDILKQIRENKAITSELERRNNRFY